MKRALFGAGSALLLTLVLWPIPALPAQTNAGPAITALRERAAVGEAQAQYDLAIALLCGTALPRNPTEAARLLTLAATQSHVGAQSVLGWLHMTGAGTRRDDIQAARWLAKATEGGDTAAANNLGILYALGQGVEKDHGRAEHWFNVAAERGATDAVRNLEVLRATPDGPDTPQAEVVNFLHPTLTKAGCRRSTGAVRN